ncbi:MAG: methyltransferase domain-containing protein [Pseudomonadota bacterium]
MQTDKHRSRPVVSSQTGPHANLPVLVKRHRSHVWQQPIHAASRAAFEFVFDWLDPNKPLILDSGCGTGHSVLALAMRYPGAQVLGLDQSAARLQRAPDLPVNARLIRARCEDVWRLLRRTETHLNQHYLLYPNPWPKPGHLARRWHAHPAFPDLLALGGRLQLRSNWKIYADEFRAALQMYGRTPSPVVSFTPDQPLTLFERKYARSGHSLYRLIVELC